MATLEPQNRDSSRREGFGFGVSGFGFFGGFGFGVSGFGFFEGFGFGVSGFGFRRVLGAVLGI